MRLSKYIAIYILSIILLAAFWSVVESILKDETPILRFICSFLIGYIMITHYKRKK